MANRCPGCGKFLSQDDVKCPNCGTLVKAGKSPVKPAQPKKVEKAKPVVQDENVKVDHAPRVIRGEPIIITKYETKYVEEPIGFDSVSYFDGYLYQMVGRIILGFLVTFFTLGICFPFAYVWMTRWECRHTVVRGYRMVFDGKGAELMPRWLLWYLLSIITFGIYGWWNPIRFRMWKASHLRLTKDKKRK